MLLWLAAALAAGGLGVWAGFALARQRAAAAPPAPAPSPPDDRLRIGAAVLDVAEGAAKFGIWEHDLASNWVTLSPGAARLSGFPPQLSRVRPEELHARVHPDDAALVGGVGVCLDIHEERPLLDQLRENADRMAQAEAWARRRAGAADAARRTGARIGEFAGARARVLVVEDNPVNQNVALRQLALLGVQADVAANGREAVAMTAGAAYDVVLMDCQLPDLDGYAATTAIRRAEGPNQSVPIVAMTADVVTADRQRSLDAGMSDCLSKPIELDDLARVLRTWLRPAPPKDREPVRPVLH